MPREKQIEDMAKVIDESHWRIEQDFTGCHINGTEIAEHLCEQGYLKQSEGKWKQAYNSFPRYVCTHCNHLYNNKSFKYCPNCGAKMKGGAE